MYMTVTVVGNFKYCVGRTVIRSTVRWRWGWFIDATHHLLKNLLSQGLFPVVRRLVKHHYCNREYMTANKHGRNIDHSRFNFKPHHLSRKSKPAKKNKMFPAYTHWSIYPRTLLRTHRPINLPPSSRHPRRANTYLPTFPPRRQHAVCKISRGLMLQLPPNI